MIKSPLRYPGGKSRAVEFLSKFIPNFQEYREPFLGGGSFALYISQNFSNKEIFVNDLNYELFCFWNELKNNSSLLAEEIRVIKNQYKNGKELYHLILARRNNDLSQLQRAVDFFILNRITFSGVVDSGGYSQKSFEARFTDSSVERLEKTGKIISNFKFSNDDYAELIQKDGKDVFIFLDPPYFSATKSRLYGKNGVFHTEFNHQKLFECLENCKHKWIMTYDDSEYIRNIYHNFEIIDWELQYGMNNYKQVCAKKGKEILISNFAIKDYRKYDLFGQLEVA